MPDFSGITRTEFDQVVGHMLREGYLFESERRLSMGDVAERIFGRKNFMELYAVFSTPQLYNVVTQVGKPLGSLEQNFVDKLVEGVSCFLLGGRAWVVQHVKHSERTVLAVPAPAGRKPSWGGFVPQFLGFEVCRKMSDLLTSDAPLPYLDPDSQRSLDTMRLELGSTLRRRTFAHEITADGELLWTFAGGAVNQTLKYGLAILRGWNAAADNFRLKLPADDVTVRALEEALAQLSDPDFWDDPKTETRLLGMLPEYRLSKFQRALPQRFSTEMVKDYLLDIPATLRFLAPQTTPQPG